MLKMHPNLAAGELSQRRPSRIGASNSVGQQQQDKFGVQPNGGRVKSSAIARVPLAKSRLHHQQQQQQQQPQQPVATAGKNNEREKSINRRPTSLSLGCGATRTMPNSRSSLLPTSQTVSVAATNRVKTTTMTTSRATISKRAALTPTTSQVPASDDCKREGNQKSEAAANDIQSGLKNLVAVVHPQHLGNQRVNSSASPASTTNKPTLTTSAKPPSATATPLTTTTTTTTANSADNKLMSVVKVESGKVNSNHKDVNGRETGGKQDGSRTGKPSQLQQMLFGSQKTTTPAGPAGDQVRNVSGGRANTNGGQRKAAARITTTPMATRSLTTTGRSAAAMDNNRHDDGQQFLLCNGNNNYNNHRNDKNCQQTTSATLTVAPRNLAGDHSGDKDDCLPHEKSKQAASKEHFPTGHAIAAASIDNFNRPSASIINNESACNRLLSKPMGQQVLSLMMLDVGLMPSNNHPQQHQYYHQVQQPSHNVSSPVSHVRIQSPSERDDERQFGGHDSNRCLFQNGFHNQSSERDNIDTSESSAVREQTANIPVNEMLRLKLSNLELDFNSQRTRSISLPSSPRLRVRQHCQQSSVIGAHQLDHQHHQVRGRVSCMSPNYSNDRQTGFPATNRLLSPLRYGCEQQNYSQRTSVAADRCRDDPCSVSSSCSSLNHNYPPLLAISNQLNDLNLQELMLQRQTCQTSQGESKQQPSLNTTNTGQTNDPIEVPTANRLTETAHKSNCPETGTTNGNNNNNNGDTYTSDGNRFNACLLLSAKPSDTDSGYENIGDHSPGAAGLAMDNCSASDGVCYRGGESCPNPSLRQRQQQQRSHSISGQELGGLSGGNGGYQRLNQFITQHVPPEIDHRLRYQGMQTPPNLTYQPNQQQQHQHLRAQLSGRSPSPLGYSGHIDQNRDILSSSKYQNDLTLKSRGQLHASLECLNSSYLEYQHQQQQIRQQQQHYAATNFILATPPANTVVNQNGDQDLAAAAMVNHQAQSYQSHQQPMTPNNIYAHQSIINRAMAQVHQSPARRFSSAQHGPGGGNMASGLHHPIRAGHSSLSLSSSSYIIEDKLQNEIKKLHSELKSEKEKNEALNSQLNINSNLMAAFEQSLTTLNSRLRQLTTINERKDQEIEELRVQLRLSKLNVADESQHTTVASNNNSPTHSETHLLSPGDATKTPSGGSHMSGANSPDEREDLAKVIEDLKRQLIEKDRLLTDTRLEALSAAHQLEQLESRLDKEHRSMVVNEEDLDEGVMVVNHSPSDSDAVTDSAHFSEINTANQMAGEKSCNAETPMANRASAFDASNYSTTTSKSNLGSSPESNNNNNINHNGAIDNSSSHSSEVARAPTDDRAIHMSGSVSQQFSDAANGDTSPMDRLMDSLLSSAS